MNRNFAIALILATATMGTAFAAEGVDNTAPFVSTATRAQVQAELAQFQREGVNPWSREYNPLAQFQSTENRAHVTADFISARDEVAALNSEGGGAGQILHKAGVRQQVAAQ